MKTAIEPTKTAMLTRLKAISTGVLDRFYWHDYFRPNQPMPYGYVGSITTAPYDTANTDGMEATFEIHLFSDKLDGTEIYTAHDELTDLFDYSEFDLSADSHANWWMNVEFQQVLTEDNQNRLIHHGVTRLHIVTQSTA